MKRACSHCGTKLGRRGHYYCRRCHAAYMRAWRKDDAPRRHVQVARFDDAPKRADENRGLANARAALGAE